MPALETVGQYIAECRRLLQDQIAPYRYPDEDIVTAMSIGLQEARRLRADLFLPSFVVPEAAFPVVPADPIVLDQMYRSALVYYVVGRMQLRDDESTTDTRAAALLQKFTAQLMVANS